MEVPTQEDLDELGDELAQIRMETVNVLRAQGLRKLVLRPGELEIDLGVHSSLCASGHARTI
jgi:hypothetical protein